jgi:hypothetical protein
MPKTLEGPLTDRGDPGQEGPGVQLTATSADRRCRFSVIADVDFR